MVLINKAAVIFALTYTINCNGHSVQTSAGNSDSLQSAGIEIPLQIAGNFDQRINVEVGGSSQSLLFDTGHNFMIF
eukprot:Pgem_evm1s9574